MDAWTQQISTNMSSNTHRADFFSRVSHAILEVIFPSCCPACQQKLLQGEHTICSSCIHSIVRTEHAIIPNNGIDMLFNNLISENKSRVRYTQGAAWGYYNSKRGATLRKLIENGKFGTRPNAEIFYILGRTAASEYIDSEIFDDVDLLVPIPLHHKRLRERGFNQSEWICKGLSEVLHIPIDTEHLIRTHNNPHQSRALFDHRIKNVEDIFTIKYPEEWKNKHILLVDDVITSGSTIFSCMKHTSSIRGCRVSVFSLGWAHN